MSEEDIQRLKESAADASSAEPATEIVEMRSAPMNVANASSRLAPAESVGTTLREAIETVGRAGSSSSLLAVNTVYRLARTMSAWIQTLEARRAELADEVDGRARELAQLERQIEQERKNAEAVAAAARNWATDIEQQVVARKADLQAESDALDAQLRAISESLKGFPGNNRDSSGSSSDTSVQAASVTFHDSESVSPTDRGPGQHPSAANSTSKQSDTGHD